MLKALGILLLIVIAVGLVGYLVGWVKFSAERSDSDAYNFTVHIAIDPGR